LQDASAMNKRLEMLEKLTRSGTADSFAWYALAMEYRKAQQLEPALQTFQTLRDKDADYVPMYLMAAQLLSEAGRDAEAVPWLEQGIEKARARGDMKALGELEQALALAR
jgi:tetratricopeptide (TPR) repeat protein